MKDETRKFLDELLSLYRFSKLCGQVGNNEIVAKKCLDHKLANLQSILEGENQ